MSTCVYVQVYFCAYVHVSVGIPVGIPVGMCVCVCEGRAVMRLRMLFVCVCLLSRHVQLDDPLLNENSFLFFGTCSKMLLVSRAGYYCPLWVWVWAWVALHALYHLVFLWGLLHLSRSHVHVVPSPWTTSQKYDQSFLEDYVTKVLTTVHANEGVLLEDGGSDDDVGGADLLADSDDDDDGDDDDEDDDDEGEEDDSGDSEDERTELYPGKPINMRIRSPYLDAKVRMCHHPVSWAPVPVPVRLCTCSAAPVPGPVPRGPPLCLVLDLWPSPVLACGAPGCCAPVPGSSV